MCGIAGVFQEPASQTVETMIGSISHRGPDGHGVMRVPNGTFGHARLAILDVEGGHQPMDYQGTSIVFNGEIYNYLELIPELEALIEGHPDLAEAHYELGLAHRKNNDYRAAALAFWRAALADPTETEHHQALGQILLRMGAPEAGTNALQHAEWVRGFFDRRFGRGSFRRPR